jgi:predicted amidophosphoribosyltransferase
MQDMYARYVCEIFMRYMYARYVCKICMRDMYAIHVCEICMRYMYVKYVLFFKCLIQRERVQKHVARVGGWHIVN